MSILAIRCVCLSTCQLFSIINRQKMIEFKAKYRKHNSVQLHFNTLSKAKAAYALNLNCSMPSISIRSAPIVCQWLSVCYEWAKFVSLITDDCIQVSRPWIERKRTSFMRLITSWRGVHLKRLSTWISDQAIQGMTSVFLVSFLVNFQQEGSATTFALFHRELLPVFYKFLQLQKVRVFQAYWHKYINW